MEDVVIDISITTYHRLNLFFQVFDSILEAIENSSCLFRILVVMDSYEKEEILSTVEKYNDVPNVSYIFLDNHLGLPFFDNLLLEYEECLSTRVGRYPNYLCYFQDDCLIKYPSHYFDEMLKVYSFKEELEEFERIGFVSGFYSYIHPGYKKVVKEGKTYVFSDTITGLNIFGPYNLWKSIGKMPDIFLQGNYKDRKRGNPGPKLGSEFDIWKWKKSPKSTINRDIVHVIVPGLCENIGIGKENSTWKNDDGKEEYIQKRIERGQIYRTRDSYSFVEEDEFYSLEKEGNCGDR